MVLVAAKEKEEEDASPPVASSSNNNHDNTTQPTSTSDAADAGASQSTIVFYKDDHDHVDVEVEDNVDGVTKKNKKKNTKENINDEPKGSSTSFASFTPLSSSSSSLWSYQLGLVIFSALYTTFFSGAFFGWGPMQLMLEDDGAFHFKCNTNNQSINIQVEDEVEDVEVEIEVCASQTLSLLNVQFIAILMPLVAPILGYITDQYGVLYLMQLLALSNISGIILIIIASFTGIDQLYYVAFCGIGITFVATSIIIVQTGLVFDTPAAIRRVISLLNVLIDAGSITYLILYKLYILFETTLISIMFGYLSVAIVCFSGAIYFWINVISITSTNQQEEDEDEHHEHELDTTTSNCPTTTTTTTTNDKETDDSIGKTNKTETTAKTSTPEITERRESEEEDEEIAMTSPPTCKTTNKDKNEKVDERDGQGQGYIVIALRPSKDQLQSLQFILLVIFFMFHVARNNFILTTSREWLATLGDDEEDNKYLSIFTSLSIASMIGLPFIDYVLEHYGYHIGFQTINCLGIVHGIIQCSTTNLNIQIIGFVIFSFYRCFTFATSFSFLSTFLGGETIGRGAGYMSFSGAIASLVNIGIAYWIVHGLHEDYFIINLLYTIGIIPIIIVTCSIGRCIIQETVASKELSNPDELDHSRGHVEIQLTPHLAVVLDTTTSTTITTKDALDQSHHSNHSIGGIVVGGAGTTKQMTYVHTH